MKVLVVQSGGPSPGSNPALAGAMLACGDGCELLGAVGGWIGLARGNLISLKGLNPKEVAASPSPYLVTFRDKTSVEELVSSIGRLGIDAILTVGGEGSMAFLSSLKAGVATMGIAKTIDNDLGPFHHDLGYASSAEAVADMAVRMRYDASSYIGYVEADIMQVMGRDAGWLTLASALAGNLAPDMILLPEATYDVSKVLEEAKGVVARRGKVLIAISEGVTLEEDKLVRAKEYQKAGTAPALRELLQGQGMRARYEWPGVLYRCVEPNEKDQREGMELGRLAIELLRKGEEGVLGPDEKGKPQLFPLGKVSKRYVPPSFLDGFSASAEALDYLKEVATIPEKRWVKPLGLTRPRGCQLPYLIVRCVLPVSSPLKLGCTSTSSFLCPRGAAMTQA
ncbi:6-phosphofructokinase [Tardisphaera miroshnichenkoae]